MKKIFYISLMVLFLFNILVSEEYPEETKTSKGMNSIYLEGGGNGLFLTLNYERLFANQCGLRVGTLIIPTRYGVSLFGTLMGNKLWCKGNLKLETGMGVMMITGEYMDMATDGTTASVFAFTGTLGIRYQPKGKGFLFRLSFTPIAFPNAVIPWAGASIGYSFK